MSAEHLSPSAQEAGEELAGLFSEDQSDRTSWPMDQIDIEAVMARDAARLERVKEMCRGQALRTGADYYHAAMILQHAHEPEDYLLAHELCVVAIGKGEERAKWLAAASEDRYLASIGRPQRFGTQYHTDDGGKSWYLYQVDPDFSDDLRRAFNVPPLSGARAHLERMNANPAPSVA